MPPRRKAAAGATASASSDKENAPKNSAAKGKVAATTSTKRKATPAAKAAPKASNKKPKTSAAKASKSADSAVASSSKSGSASAQSEPEYIEFWTLGETKNNPSAASVPRLFRKPEDKYGGGPNIIWNRSYSRLIDMYNGIDMRNPELNGIIHIYEDWAGEGIVEVVEKNVADYEKEARKKEPDIWVLWEICEALGFLLAGEDDQRWIGIGDSEGLEQLLKLIGSMFIDCLKRIDETGFLVPDGKIKNVGLVMGLMAGLADQWESIGDEPEDCCQWKINVIKMAEKKGVKMQYLMRDVQDYEIKESDKKRKEQKTRLDFKKQVTSFKRESYGGRWPDFDAHKIYGLSRAEKKKLSNFSNWSGSDSEGLIDDEDSDGSEGGFIVTFSH